MRNLFKLQSVYSPNLKFGPLKGEQEWMREIGEPAFQLLVEHGALYPTSISELNGFEGNFDFSEGRKTYRLEVTDENAVAYPIDKIGADHIVSADKIVCLRSSPQKIMNLFAQLNCFESDLPGKNGALNFCVARKRIGAHSVAIVFITNNNYFLNDEAWLYLSSLLAGMQQIIIVTDGRGFQARVLPNLSSPQILSISECKEPCILPRYIYCHPKYNIDASDAALVYSEKEVVLDSINKTLYISGTKIKFQKTGLAFNYAVGVCSMAETEMVAEQFSKKYLGHSSNMEDFVAVVRGARRLLSDRIEFAFKNDPDGLAKAITYFLTNENGVVKRGFLREKTLFWDENHSEV